MYQSGISSPYSTLQEEILSKGMAQDPRVSMALHLFRCPWETLTVGQMAANLSSHAKCDFLDGKRIVFRKIIDGLLVIEDVPTGPKNRPKLPVVITQCGEMQCLVPGATCIMGMK